MYIYWIRVTKTGQIMCSCGATLQEAIGYRAAHAQQTGWECGKIFFVPMPANAFEIEDSPVLECEEVGHA
jgi:hypothetical protein